MGCSSTGFTPNSYSDDIQAKIDDHPCFSKEAHHHYARIHVAVAPACNIQCNYCNRKYDCSNESRPGVTSERLKADEAVKKVLYVGGELHRLSVVGIAGPGDALANPKATFETFEKLNKYAPDLKLCLSTNGLKLAEYAEKIAQYNIDHVTVTLNSLDESGEVGSKIYPWIFYDHKRRTGTEAAKILLEKQLEGIQKCVDLGILIKINTVLISGINEGEIPKISKKMKEMGVFLHNIMPHLSDPAYGTKFGLDGVPSTTEAEVKKVKKLSGMEIDLMDHCRQCRADAVGLIGEDKSSEFLKNKFVDMSYEELSAKYDLAARTESREKIKEFREILKRANEKAETVKKELSTNGKTILVAVTTEGEGLVNQHFGNAKEFLIYEAGDLGVRFLTHRKIDTNYCNGEDSCGVDTPIEQIKTKLKDCKILLTAKIGDCPQGELKEIKLQTSEAYAYKPIEESVLEATKNYFVTKKVARG